MDLIIIFKIMTPTTYLILLPLLIIVYMVICISYNLIKYPKEYKKFIYKFKKGDIPAIWIGLPIFIWILMFFFVA